MKKLTIFLLIFVLNLSLIPANALDFEYIKIHVPEYFSIENQKEISESIVQVKSYLKNKIRPTASFSKELDVPVYKQEKNYYCGVAATQMIASYKGQYYTQSELAKRLNANGNDGVIHGKISEVLNKILGKKIYHPILTASLSLREGLEYSIDKDLPIICHISVQKLKIYQRANEIRRKRGEKKLKGGHYVVGTGYAWYFFGNQGGNDIYYNDPHYDENVFGAHRTSISEMQNAMKDFYTIGI